METNQTAKRQLLCTATRVTKIHFINPRGYAIPQGDAPRFFKKEHQMLKVTLAVDPQTQRALYADERKCLGVFQDFISATNCVGEEILRRFCNLTTV